MQPHVDVGQQAPVHAEPRPHWMQYVGHLVNFREFETPLRWMARVAAVVAPLALLTLLLPLGHMPAIPMPGVPGRLPAIVLWVGVGTQALGWWYLLLGASSAHTVLRWLAALLFCAMQALAYIYATHAAALTIVLTLVFAGLTQWRLLRGWPATLASGLLVTLFFAIVWTTGEFSFANNILTQMAYFYLLTLPLIFYSGVDLGETGLFLTRLGLWHLHPRIAPQTLWWLALGLVSLKFALMLPQYPNDWGTVAVLAVLSLGAWLTQRMRTHGEPPAALALGFALIYFLYLSPLATTLWHWAAAVALLLSLVLLALGQRLGRMAGTVAVFLMLFGLWNLSLGITEQSIDEAITIAALLYLLYLRARGPLLVERVMMVVFWVVGFTALSYTYVFMSGLHDLAGGFQTAATLLLVVALTHDLLASGTLLNGHSLGMPRQARVLMYLGYVLLTAGSTVLANGPLGPLAYHLDTDSIQIYGLIALGIPIFLQHFLHTFSFGHRPELLEEERGSTA